MKEETSRLEEQENDLDNSSRHSQDEQDGPGEADKERQVNKSNGQSEIEDGDEMDDNFVQSGNEVSTASPLPMLLQPTHFASSTAQNGIYVTTGHSVRRLGGKEGTSRSCVLLTQPALFTVSDEASLCGFLPPTRFLNHGASHQYQWRNPLCSSRSLVILLKDSGRSVKLTTQDYSSSAVVANITKTGDGAVVNTGNADVLLYQVHLFDCHARNGGAAFLQKCQHVYVDDMLTLRCSVESKGGAIFVLSVDRNSDINLQPTLIECSDKLGG
ncbi:hypothetical protein BLNAU_21056 [Blattamonas nauphoetae]|uniref:Uncharacterized protein n=1 Tax=Blattamonas nauphoetae TaxID=2049346 RepID=A0ABQ9WX16_9EUKA|nr:hypothetical protein BLNAU_21056 [Blattamonas nauphoetae]